MAMTNCKECRAEISTTAKACPKCGAVVPKAKLWPWIVGVPIAAFVALMLFGLTIPEYESQALAQRKVCEQIAPMQHVECRRIYDRAIADGRARGAK